MSGAIVPLTCGMLELSTTPPEVLVVSIPALTAVASATFTCSGSSHNSMFTCGLTNPLGNTPNAINTVFRANLITAGNPFEPAFMSNQWALAETKVITKIGSLLYTDVNPTPSVGTAVIAPIPMNSAVLISKQTGLAGRAYRGRMFTPPTFPAEINVTAAGILQTSDVTALNTRWLSWFNALVTAGYRPCLIHLTSGTWTLISSLATNGKVGTIKHRLRG